MSGLAQDSRYAHPAVGADRPRQSQSEEAVGEILSTSQLVEMMKLVRFQGFWYVSTSI